MIEVNVLSEIIKGYNTILDILPKWGQDLVILFLMILLIFVYSIFVWKFYTSISKKNLFGLDLNQYVTTEDHAFRRIFTGTLYFLEYIIISPIVIFVWLSVLSLFLIALTQLEVSHILLVSSVLVIAARMASYYRTHLAEDIGKLVPFTILATSLLTPGFFSFERVLNNFRVLPEFLNQIFIYLLFIALIEIILRFFDFIFSLQGNSDEENLESHN